MSLVLQCFTLAVFARARGAQLFRGGGASSQRLAALWNAAAQDSIGVQPTSLEVDHPADLDMDTLNTLQEQAQTSAVPLLRFYSMPHSQAGVQPAPKALQAAASISRNCRSLGTTACCWRFAGQRSPQLEVVFCLCHPTGASCVCGQGHQSHMPGHHWQEWHIPH